MNKKINSLLALSLMIVMVIATSCSKDDKDEAPSNTALLTSHAWKFGSVESSDVFTKTLLSALYGQSTTTFKADKSYSMSILGQSATGTWEFSDGEKKLIQDKGTDEELNYEILRLSSDNLDLKLVSADASEVYTLKLVK